MSVRISTEDEAIDLDWLVDALSERAYWALGRSRDDVIASIRGSMCFSAHDGDRQVGFARVITDHVTFAWICDVFVDETARGRGVGRQLIDAVVNDPTLRDVRRMVLATRDAADFYRPFGFQPLANPERWLERRPSS